jgi:uncharacterized protein
MRCPVCEETLREVEKHGVEVDVCPGCRGVWLDRGELDKLLAMGQAGSPLPAEADSRSREPYSGRRGEGIADHGAGRGHYDEHGHDGEPRPMHDGGRRRRPGSWLGDVLGSFGGGED